MKRFTYGVAVLGALTVGFVACAPMPEDQLLSSDGRRQLRDDDGDDDTDEDARDEDDPGAASSPGTKPSSKGSPGGAEQRRTPEAAGPPTLTVTFAASAGQTFGGAKIARVCSDRGAHHQNATFVDGTSLSLVRVDDPGTVVGRVDGAALDDVKSDVLSSGELSIEVDPKTLRTEPHELAIVMGGDSRFGSPAQCKTSLQPKSAKQRDVEEFPSSNTMAFNTKIAGRGCGVVGYVEAYWDAEQQKVVARASSQLLLAADDEGRAGFPKGSYYPGCDGHDSPLVLDLSGRGVRLSAPIASVFDVDGDGALDDSPWVVSDDTPFLVRDANDNGVVDGVDELFGNRTRGPWGRATSQNGFEALAAWDESGDGVIDASDPVWASLRLWFDRNHDGRTDPGELETLEARGVRSIALSFVSVNERLAASGRVQGAVRQRGAATMTDGRIVSVVDVWFHRRF